MNEFWHTVDELEPPRNKNVWTTSNPFSSVPAIRINSWGGPGIGWRNHCYSAEIYWAEPINKKRDEQ